MRYFWRKFLNYFFQFLMGLGSCLILGPLFLVFYFVTERGYKALSWDFLFHLPASVGETGGGVGNALLGSVIVVSLASLIGIPWGIAGGVYLSEYRDRPLSKILRFVSDLLTSVPSIIWGLFVNAILVVKMGSFSAYAGGLALSFIMIPNIVRTTEEILKLVPQHIREAGLALGISRWRVILQVVLWGNRRSVLTGVLLSISRISGESAPLLFTAFGNRFWSRSLSAPTSSLPVQIYTYAISPYEEWHTQAWGAALILLGFVFCINLLSRLVLRERTYRA